MKIPTLALCLCFAPPFVSAAAGNEGSGGPTAAPATAWTQHELRTNGRVAGVGGSDRSTSPSGRTLALHGESLAPTVLRTVRFRGGANGSSSRSRRAAPQAASSPTSTADTRAPQDASSFQRPSSRLGEAFKESARAFRASFDGHDRRTRDAQSDRRVEQVMRSSKRRRNQPQASGSTERSAAAATSVEELRQGSGHRQERTGAVPYSSSSLDSEPLQASRSTPTSKQAETGWPSLSFPSLPLPFFNRNAVASPSSNAVPVSHPQPTLSSASSQAQSFARFSKLASVGLKWLRVSLFIYLTMEVLDYCGWVDQNQPNKLKQNMVAVWHQAKPRVSRWRGGVLQWWNHGKQTQQLWHPHTWSTRRRLCQALHRMSSKRQFAIGAWLGMIITSSALYLATTSAAATAIVAHVVRPLSLHVLRPVAAVYACSEANYAYKQRRAGWNLKEVTGGDDTIGQYIDRGLESFRIRARNLIRRVHNFFAADADSRHALLRSPEEMLLDEEINSVLRSSGGTSNHYFSKVRQQFIELQQGIKELKDEMGVGDMLPAEEPNPSRTSPSGYLNPGLPISLKKGFVVGIGSGVFLLGNWGDE